MAQYIPMVAGIIKRVRNSGEVSRLNAFVVYENDTFHVAYGLEMTLKHEPNFADPGKPIGAYAVCLFKDGETDFEFMSVKQIEGIRERSKYAGQYDPWKTDWSEMAAQDGHPPPVEAPAGRFRHRPRGRADRRGLRLQADRPGGDAGHDDDGDRPSRPARSRRSRRPRPAARRPRS